MLDNFTEQLWGSLDAAWYSGGQASINGVTQGKKLNNVCRADARLQHQRQPELTFGYKSTVNDNGPGDLQMDSFMVSFVFGWQPLLEGSKRLKGEK